jgi:hypothetical protein
VKVKVDCDPKGRNRPLCLFSRNGIVNRQSPT